MTDAGAQSADATWTGNVDSNWLNSANWSPAAVPSGIATFGTLGRTTVELNDAGGTIGAFDFEAGAPAYTFNFSALTAQRVFTINGAGIQNDSGRTPVFNLNTSNAHGVGLSFIFRGSASAANAQIKALGATGVWFLNTATAGTATISTASTILFEGNSTGGAANITALQAYFNQNNGSNASAGSATFTINEFVHFKKSSTGGQARFILNTRAGNPTFDISGLTSTGMTVGSLEGKGWVNLGSRNLEVGNNELSTKLTAVIQDGGTFDQSAVGGSLTKVDIGTLTLTGENTYTGGTTITGGAIQLGDGGTTGSIVGDIVNNAALIFNRSNAYTFAGTISGAGTVTQKGSGTTTLTGTNSYSGGTVLNAGELSVAADGFLGDASGALTFDGGILQVTGTGFTSFAATNRSIVWGAGGGGFDIADAGNTFTVSQALGAGGALTKLGAGALVLTGASTFSGDLNVAAGALTIDNGGSLTPGNVSVAASNSANATLTIQGSSTVTSSATSFPLIGVGSGASGLVTVTGARSAWSVNGSPLNASVILGRNGGTGTLEISDRGSGTFVGDLVIGEKDGTGIMEVKNSGTLKIEKNGYIGRKSGSNGTATVADRNSHWSILGELFIGNGGSGTLNINNHGKVSVATTTTVADSGSQGKLNITTGGALETQRLVRGTGPAQVKFDGGILRATATNNTNFISGFTGVEFNIAAGGMTLDSNTFDATAAAVLSGTGALTKIGTGTLTLSGNNSYQGGTFLDAGILSVAADANLGASSGALTFNGGTLETTQSFTSNRAVTLGTGGGTFDTDANTGLLLSGRITGSGALTKTGAGALVLSGRNQYSGPTTLNAGVLVITGDQTAATGPTTVRNGGILGGSGTIGGIVNVESGGTLASVYGTNPYLLGGPSLAYKLTIKDDLTLASGAALDYAYFVSPNSSHDALMIDVAGDVNLGGATVNVANDSGPLAPGLYGLVSYSGTKTGTLNQGTLPAGTYVETALAGHIYLVNPAGLNLTYWNGSGAGSGSLKGGDGVWQGPAGNHNWSNVSGSISGPYDNGGFPIFAGSGGTVTVDDMTAGPISAAGMQFVADGYVITGDPITLVAAPIANSATITVSANAGAPYKATINSVLQGTTSLTKDGRGTLVLTGINIYSGGTMINAGTLSISADANLGTGALNLQHGGTLETTQAFASNRAVTLGTGGGVFKTDANLTLNGVISGAGSLTKTGAGTLTLSGTNTYGGGTLIDAGVLSVSSDGNLGAADGALTFAGGTLQNTAAFSTSRTVTLGTGGGTFQTDADLTLTGTIGGTGALTKTGAATLILTGDNAYGGGTTIASGTLQLGDGGTAGNIKGNVSNDGTLAFNRSDTINTPYTFAGAISGSGTIAQIGPGVTVLSGASGSFSGTTAVKAGTLLVDGTLGGTMNVAADGTLGGDGTITGKTTVAGTLAGREGEKLSFGSDLVLNAGATVTVTLGTPGNDTALFAVTGNLTLDGTLNVASYGGFGPGHYRLFDYGGTLTDNGFAIGSTPHGIAPSDLGIDTGTSGQVDLVSAAGVDVHYWDGDYPAHHDNNAVDGGDGTWNLSNNDWTEKTGDVNGAWVNGRFAIFKGDAGTVKVDDAGGEISVAGMQFAVDGYRIEGDAIVLGSAQSIIRTGTGGRNHPHVAAAIAARLTGSGGLVKTDYGTLVLTGNNEYSGGTTIREGTLQIGDGGSSGSIAGNVSNSGTLRFNRSGTLAFAGVISGTGALEQAGPGVTVLSGKNSYEGTTKVKSGRLAAGTAGAFSAASAFTVAGGAALDLAGYDQAITSLTNAGLVRLGETPGTVLTVSGDYTGKDGTILLNTALGGDNSITDRLVVDGSTSGKTTLAVRNVGGVGAPTHEGIKVVDVEGTSGGTFTLLGDYTFLGAPAVVAGAYAYRLYKNGITDPNDGDWYLRSTPEHPKPHYQPGAPVYEAYGQALLELNSVGTVRERLGNRLWQGDQPDITTAATSATMPETDGTAMPLGSPLRLGTVWGRIEAGHGSFAPHRAISSMDYDTNSWKLQAGVDAGLKETARGDLVGGLFVQYGTVSADVTSPHGDGGIDAKGYGLGGTLTWFGTDGLYVDGLAQATWYDSDLTSSTASRDLVTGNDGFGYALSLEAGREFTLAPNWSVTPQAQLVYSSVDFDAFTDTFGSRVSLDTADSLKGRAGLAADYRTAWRDESGQAASARLYGLANLTYEMLDGVAIDLANTAFATANDRLWGALGVGGSYSWADNKYALHGELAVDTSLDNFADSYAVTGNVGLKVRW